MLEQILVEDYASEGKSIAKIDGKVHFIQNAVPGDVVDLKVFRRKKNYAEATVTKFHSFSEQRAKPFCVHFGICGGCSWQNLKYERQLYYKQQEIESAFKKIKLDYEYKTNPIIGSDHETSYRNKLEFTFSHHKWIVDPTNLKEQQGPALGFHIPGRFDKILDIQQCHLQNSKSNAIRDFVKGFCLEQGYTFFDLRNQVGIMRNLIIRNTSLDEWMIILVFAEDHKSHIQALLRALKDEFSWITSLYYIVNQKKNDTIYDQSLHLYNGKPNIREVIDGIYYDISPKSFFQVNHSQTLKLYRKIIEYAKMRKDDIVYDLYCGTGSISLQLAEHSKKVVGIEYIDDAVNDARANARLNHISNVEFYAGDMAQVLNSDFYKAYGKPSVIVLDPPRSGVHPNVIHAIIQSGAERLVYVSCNVHTQTRDIDLLRQFYILEEIQPADLFPHTKHCENIAVLKRKNNII